MKTASGVRERTRRAILEALADVITESDGIGFSVQAVADRAGVTHRTVYNHFPTRDALCEAFYDYVDEVLMTAAPVTPAVLQKMALPDAVGTLYAALQQRDRHVRAIVILMIANRRSPKVWHERTGIMERWISARAASDAPLPSRQVAAAVRLFASSMGWHLLTELCGLSNEEAVATSVWATETLVAAGTKGTATSRKPPSKKRRATDRRR